MRERDPVFLSIFVHWALLRYCLTSLHSLCPLDNCTFCVFGCKFLLTLSVVIPFTRLSLICPSPFSIRIQCSFSRLYWAAVAREQQLGLLIKSAVGGVVVMSNVVIVSWMSGMCNCFSLVRSVLKLSHTTTLWLWWTQVICMNSKTFMRQH